MDGSDMDMFVDVRHKLKACTFLLCLQALDQL